MTSLTPPPLRDLPAGRLEQRRLHLLAEIAESSSVRRFRPRGRQWRRRTSVLVVATTAIVVVVGAAVLATRWGAVGASAAQVRASITQGLSTPRNTRGRFSVESRPAKPRPRPIHGCSNCTPPLPSPSAFVLGADGSYSSRALASTQQYPASAAYDAPADLMTQVGSLRHGPI
jgi:hypothetical protein